MTILYVILVVLLVVAAFLALIRVERGPSILNRAVSVDVVTSALIGFTAIFSVMEQRSDLVIIMVALALVGFLSTVTVARFAAADNDVERRILTREELERLALEEEQLDDEAAPVHDVDALEAEQTGEIPVVDDATSSDPAAEPGRARGADAAAPRPVADPARVGDTDAASSHPATDAGRARDAEAPSEGER